MTQTPARDEIPGLFFFPEYFSASQSADLTRETLALHARLEQAAASGQSSPARIPQPKFVRSDKHNLASEEFFVSLELPEAKQRKLRCEYFPKYGEDGHALGYFRGNDNLPDFVAGGFLASVQKTMETLGLIESGKDLTWKLTVNIYQNIGGQVAGFPFHVDIPANGVVTMILNVQREALFQIAKDECVHDIQLPIGGLLVLSGESRYQWKHRVLPTPSEQTNTGNCVERASLVLGFQ